VDVVFGFNQTNFPFDSCGLDGVFHARSVIFNATTIVDWSGMTYGMNI
jgi:hypothetical protein